MFTRILLVLEAFVNELDAALAGTEIIRRSVCILKKQEMRSQARPAQAILRVVLPGGDEPMQNIFQEPPVQTF